MQDIPESMKAAVKVDKDTIELRNVPVPSPQAGQILVKIKTVGVCATDVHLLRESFSYLQMAQDVSIVGHEGCGTVVALGPGVSGVEIGERVAVRWLYSVCQECELCQTGFENLCNKRKLCGKDVNGCFAEYAVTNANYLIKLPDGVSDIDASPILCAGVTVYKALKISATRSNGWVALPGAAGGLGHLAIQYAKALGYRVIAIDGGKEKGELCKSLGAEAYIDFTEGKDIVQEVIRVSDGGAHCAIVTASSIRAYSDALKYLRKSGALICIGLPPQGQTIPAGPADFIGRGLRVMGSSIGTLQDTIEALEFVKTGAVKPRCVSAKLDDISTLLEQLEKGAVAGRYVIEM